VILVGEMRDRETVEIAMSAAETGHLVLSTLHTVDAGQTISRILGMFDKDEERLVRIRLADTLRWVVSQRLLPKIGGGRVAALEIMGANLRVKDSMLNGESEGKTFYEIIEANEPFGMQTFDQNIIKLYQEEVIAEDTALAYASRKSVARRGIDDVKKKQGIITSDIEELALDPEYGKTTLTRQSS
jgi:twitching motility protein PilT